LEELISYIYYQYKGTLGVGGIENVVRQDYNCVVNHKRVHRIMKKLNIKAVIRRKSPYKRYHHKRAGRIYGNLLKRNFHADNPNEKLVTDITEFKVSGNKLYLSPIIDLFNGEIISYELSEKPNFKQVVAMLKKSFKKIPNQTNLILHSDQGWQYQMRQYQRLLKDKGITQSMSRKGNCLDNAVIESFFGILKSELFYINKYKSISQLKKDIKVYIKYYNNERIKLNLKGMSPIEYRAHYYQN
jgi:putative transposase